MPSVSVRTPPMPDRALRPTGQNPAGSSALSPNASNARQGIKTAQKPPAPAGLCPVRTPPMPDRALRPISVLPPRGRLSKSPNASNARQGIKTFTGTNGGVQDGWQGPNASNARQGIKTWCCGCWMRRPARVRTPPMPDRALRLLTRQGRQYFRGIRVRTPPMPDRALRLIACDLR